MYFGTPGGSWSTRVYEMARRWVSAGHEVEVITSPYEKSDMVAEGFISKRRVDGIYLTVIDSGDNNRLSFLARVQRSLVFALVSSWFSLTRPYDVLLVSSGPITVGIPMLLSSLFRNKRYVFEMRDLWPGGAIELGLIQGKLKQWVAWKFEAWCYRRADLVVFSSKGQQEDVLSRYALKNWITIPNSSDNELFGRSVKQSGDSLSSKPFLFLHIGSLGLIHNVGYWIDVAECLWNEGEQDIRFVFIGEGSEKEALESRCRQLALDNVSFLGLMPKRELPQWLHRSYATLFSTLPTKVQDACSPNKVFDSFAAGVPVIQTSRGWIRELFKEEACGLNVPLDDPGETANVIRNYVRMPELRERHATNALRLAQGPFDRGKLSVQYLEALEKLL